MDWFKGLLLNIYINKTEDKTQLSHTLYLNKGSVDLFNPSLSLSVWAEEWVSARIESAFNRSAVRYFKVNALKTCTHSRTYFSKNVNSMHFCCISEGKLQEIHFICCINNALIKLNIFLLFILFFFPKLNNNNIWLEVLLISKV
jgi:hypothetical protein